MAIDDPLDEHEQSERVLAWLRQNGIALVGGIVLGLAAIGGWKWWGHHQHTEALADADRYQQVISAIEAGDPEAASRITTLDNGVYAELAGLELASRQVRAGDNEKAIATLRGIKPADERMATIVHQRLARLLVDAGKGEEAIGLLEGADTAMALEVRGDAEYALGKTDDARSAYMQALTRMDVASPRRKLLELKLMEVGGKPDDSEVRS
ncbi:tetratricopeptide repeat protein [Lysobacter ciconiae]|uniref:Ancillary SecYEG translocon subunit n=1 Tax=Novilysobacter ciconiae TaxID=2781022 RepID=A0A7S6UHZ7_9GAMM|nr:tetratricopeptide repeat protein [Lysobacter ciconiae]QOW20646.1 tetratricopeptide repeat protein [Lysobacter ciconiae]